MVQVITFLHSSFGRTILTKWHNLTGSTKKINLKFIFCIFRKYKLKNSKTVN